MDIREHSFRAALQQQMQEAITTVREGRFGQVNFSSQSHNTIADVLHEFVYATSDEPVAPVYVHVLYGDGSRGKPFPLRSLAPLRSESMTPLRNVLPLRVALISMRHLEMDPLVDIAWLLNKDIPKGRSLADVDAFSYQETQRQLREGLSNGPLKLFLYHTGFQPVIVGFYRALVEELIARRNQPPMLEVTPYYFWHIMNCYLPGRMTWS